MAVKTSDARKGAQILLDARNAALVANPIPAADVPSERQIFYGYEAMLAHVLKNGVPKADRTGTGTIGIHGYQLKFDLDNGFPFVTTKKVAVKSVIHELLWLFRGDTNIRYLVQNNVHIWNEWPFKNWWQQQPENVGKDFPQKGTELWNSLGMEEAMKGFIANIKNDEEFAKKWGELGPVYGKQWRAWSNVKNDGGVAREFSIDQIRIAVDQLKKQNETLVMNRRVMTIAWNPSDIDEMSKSGLPPCHCFFQLHSSLMTIEERRQYWAKLMGKDPSWAETMTDDELDEAGAPALKLDLQLYQRSCDIFLGVPFNIASYSLLLMIMARITNMKPGTFIHDYGDLHLYGNHIEQAIVQLARPPHDYCQVSIAERGQDIDDFTFEDIIVENYVYDEAIKADVSV